MVRITTRKVRLFLIWFYAFKKKKMRLCDGTMPLWVLSLPGSKRRETMALRLGAMNIPFRFMDGYLVTSGNTDALKDVATKIGVELPETSSLQRGDLGCLLAYFLMCKRIVDEKIPWVFIIEDDCVFNVAYPRIAEADLSDFVCSDWTFMHPNMGFSTLGQIVTYVGARKVLKHAARIIRCNLAIDLVLFSDLMADFHIASCYGTNHWLVDQEAPYDQKEFSERMLINEEN